AGARRAASVFCGNRGGTRCGVVGDFEILLRLRLYEIVVLDDTASFGMRYRFLWSVQTAQLPSFIRVRLPLRILIRCDGAKSFWA
ncbi:MAG: hypothetical protein LUC06_02325, partial [Oscillospiraceae bacterium]|nr:hypothetical protein [Oscillospiraceae bacterium]